MDESELRQLIATTVSVAPGAADDAGVILVDGAVVEVEVGTWAAQQADVRRVFVV